MLLASVFLVSRGESVPLTPGLQTSLPLCTHPLDGPWATWAALQRHRLSWPASTPTQHGHLLPFLPHSAPWCPLTASSLNPHLSTQPLMLLKTRNPASREELRDRFAELLRSVGTLGCLSFTADPSPVVPGCKCWKRPGLPQLLRSTRSPGPSRPLLLSDLPSSMGSRGRDQENKPGEGGLAWLTSYPQPHQA